MFAVLVAVSIVGTNVQFARAAEENTTVLDDQSLEVAVEQNNERSQEGEDTKANVPADGQNGAKYVCANYTRFAGFYDGGICSVDVV